MEIKGSNQSLVKVTNQHLIIKELRSHKQLSRSELAKLLQLSNPSVSKHVDNLIEKGLIVEVGSLVTDVGRRPIMLEFNGAHGCVAVIDLSSDDGRICIADLLGNKLEYSRVEGGQNITGETFAKIMDTLQEMLSGLGGRCGRLLSICIGAPGVIEPESGRILWSGRIEDYKNVDLPRLFKSRFDVPVIIKNDINLAVVGERMFGAGGGVDSMMFVGIDAGVGQSLIIDGRLYEGRNGAACDIGVLLPMSGAALEITGHTGMYMPLILENNLSVYTLVSEVRALYDEGRDTFMREWVSDGSAIVFDDVVKAYGMGDPMTSGVIKRFAKQVSILLKNFNSMLDVELILLGGAVARLGTSFLNEILDVIAVLPGYSHAEIKLSRLFDTAVIFGGIDTATQYAVDQIIEN